MTLIDLFIKTPIYISNYIYFQISQENPDYRMILVRGIFAFSALGVFKILVFWKYY